MAALPKKSAGTVAEARQLRAAMIRWWLDFHRVPASIRRKMPGTAELLNAGDDTATTQRYAQLQAETPQPGLHHVEQVLEAVIEPGRRKLHGAVYTPGYIVEHLLQVAAGIRKESEHVLQDNAPPSICDPACGAGGFLVRAVQRLSQQHGITSAEALQRVTGFDIDPQSLLHARCLLELQLASQGETALPEHFKLFKADTLLTPAGKLWKLADVPGGFDIVATNPPYVKLQTLPLPYRKQLLKRFEGQAGGAFSLALLFLHTTRQMLAPGGCAAMITQNNLFTSLAGRGVREQLQQSGGLRRILDFGAVQIFAKASAYTCLLFTGKEQAEDFEYAAIKPPVNAQTLDRVRFTRIKHAELDARKWRLAPAHHLRNLKQLETAGQRLADVAKIQVGFATLKDDVFLVEKRRDGCFAADGSPIELRATRAAIRISRYASDAAKKQRSLRVIFPYRRAGGAWKLVEEEAMRRQFPLTYDYLQRHQEALATRDKGRRPAEAWYAWGRNQSRNAPGPKLLTKTFDRRPQFRLDPSNALFCNGYSVTPRQDWLPAPLLQRFLNSAVMHYYARLTSFQIKGGYLCFQKNFIERFGLPALTPDDIDTWQQRSDDAFLAAYAQCFDIPMCDIEEVIHQ